MGRESDALFNALFALEDVRELLRRTAPQHELDEEGKEQVKKALDRVKNALSVLEEWSR